MAKELRYNITVDSSGAVSGVNRATNEFRGAEKAMKGLQSEAKKVQTAKANMGKASAAASQKITKATNQSGGAVQGFTNSIRGAAQGIAAIEGPFGGLSGRMNAFATLANTATTNVRTLTTSTHAFRTALMATGIGAIVVALGSLIAAFKSTQEGTDRLNRILVPLRSVLAAVWGVVQDLSIALADNLVAAIRDPRQALQDLVAFMVSQVQVRVRALGDSWLNFGRVLSRAVRGDIQGAREAFGDFTNSMLELGTGIEDAGDKLRNFARNTIEAGRAGYEAGLQIQALREEIERLQIEQAVPLARMKREYQELRTIAGDTQKTEEERLKAIEEAEQLLRRIQAEEQKVLDLQIEKLELQQSLNDTSREEELELQKLIARREELEAQTLRQFRTFERRRASILKGIEDEIRAEEERRIVFIAGLEERADKFREMLMTEEELLQKSHDAQMMALNELLENDILSREEYYDLRFELEASLNDRLLELTSARIESEEDMEEQKLESMKLLYLDFADTIAGVFGDIFGQSKAIAIAQALINSYQAYTRTIAQGGAFAVPVAAATLLKGFAQVAKMRSTQPQGFQTGGLVGGGRRLIEVNESNRPEFVMNDRSTSAALPLLQSMNQSPSLARALNNSVGGFQSGGATGSVRLDSSDFQKSFDEMASNLQNVEVVLSSFDVTEKIGDQQRTNSRRIVTTK